MWVLLVTLTSEEGGRPGLEPQIMFFECSQNQKVFKLLLLSSNSHDRSERLQMCDFFELKSEL